jgi:hypothetical protein
MIMLIWYWAEKKLDDKSSSKNLNQKKTTYRFILQIENAKLKI